MHIDPEWYLPIVTGCSLTWASIWLCKYLGYIFIGRNIPNKLLVIVSLVLGYTYGYWSSVFILEAARSHAIAFGVATLLLNQPIFRVAMSWMSGKPVGSPWYKVYWLLRVKIKKKTSDDPLDPNDTHVNLTLMRGDETCLQKKKD